MGTETKSLLKLNAGYLPLVPEALLNEGAWYVLCTDGNATGV